MSHGDAITAARRPASPSPRRTPRHARRRARGPRPRRSTACSSTPRSRTPSAARRSSRRSSSTCASCRPTWTNTSIIEQAVAEIRAQVGTERVICGLSGGVDSAVAAALVHKAIGDQLTCVFVDTGLLRLGEAEQVEETFRRQFAVDLVHVKAADRFLDALDDVVEPERKRKIIGETFIRVFEEAARDLGDAALPRAGHAVPRHRRVGRRRQRDHQVAPQRRRPPRRHELRARRAAAPPVQGRGARGRRGARPARGDRVAPAVPGPGPRGAHHRHDHARARRDPAAAPTRSSSRRSAGPACTARSGRASRCCPRCGPSA